MITLNLKIDDAYKKVEIKEDTIFNAILFEHPEFIKRLIKTIYPSYKISDAYFKIVNGYAEFTSDNVNVYSGLIVRTNVTDYSVLYLKGSSIDEKRMMKLIEEFIYDIDDFKAKNININKIEVDRKSFLDATRGI